MIEPLLPLVELFKIPAAHFNLVEPFKDLLPKMVQDMLTFQLKKKTRFGEAPWTSDVLLLSQTDANQRLMDIMRAIKPYLPASLQFQVAADVVPILLYHGIPGTSTAAAFHRACDGKSNTVKVIALKTGSVFVGFSGVAWSSDSSFNQCDSSFVHPVGRSGLSLGGKAVAGL
ncbi:hypothetical protein HDU81_006708 [Chytriomyces hyalinus]|nr:hypothetical protein HDU81_006708 [Chytriomyces hyalinus]